MAIGNDRFGKAKAVNKYLLAKAGGANMANGVRFEREKEILMHACKRQL